MPSEPVIHVVDDEAPFRRSLIFLLESAGWLVIGHPSAESFLAAAPALPEQGGCLLLDIRMPCMSGFELQRHLLAGGPPWPIVFMTGHGDEEMAAHALRAGACGFLHKPFAEQAVLDAVELAVRQSCVN